MNKIILLSVVSIPLLFIFIVATDIGENVLASTDCSIPVCDNNDLPIFTGNIDSHGCKIYQCADTEKKKIGLSCLSNLECESNYCLFDSPSVETGICACRNDEDCFEGCSGYKTSPNECHNGVCAYVDHQVCNKEKCNAPCATDEDCPSIYECDTDFCRCMKTCQTDDGCFEGCNGYKTAPNICSHGLCAYVDHQICSKKMCNAECENDNDCHQNEYCDTNNCKCIINISKCPKMTEPNCSSENSPFFYEDINGCKYWRCLEDYPTYAALISPEYFFIEENPRFKVLFVSASEIDYGNEKTYVKITDAKGNIYSPRLELVKFFTNSDGKMTYNLEANLGDNHLNKPIRIEYRVTNLVGEVTGGYRDDINSISINNVKCKKIVNKIKKDEGFNFFFLSNGFDERNFSDFNATVDEIINSHLFLTTPFNEFINSINIYNLYNNAYTFACQADYNPERLRCQYYDLFAIVEASCNITFRDNDILTILTSEEISNDESAEAAVYEGFIKQKAVDLHPFIHELGHAFGGFNDEYIKNAAILQEYYNPNLDFPGCKKWCSGEIDISDECYSYYQRWKNCVEPYLIDWQNHREEIQLCYTSINGQVEEKFGYPLNECELGINCFEGTGCYFGTFSIQMFRSMKDSMMTGGYGASFGPYMEYYLRERIKNVINSSISLEDKLPVLKDADRNIQRFEIEKEALKKEPDQKNDAHVKKIEIHLKKQKTEQDLYDNNKLANRNLFKKVLNWLKNLF